MFALLGRSVENAKNSHVVDAVLARLNLRSLRRRHEHEAPPQRRKILFESLEPRLLLSADLLPGAVQSPQAAQQPADIQYAPTANSPQIHWSAQSMALDAPLYTNGMVSGFDLDNFASPLVPVAPTGGLVYAGGVQGNFDYEGDSDALSIDLDGGQTFTLRFKPNADLQANLEALDPDGNSLGFLEAANPGDSLILQLRAADNAGSYSINVNSLTGAGSYTVEIFLNAAVEAADTTNAGDAQNLDDVFSYLLDSDALRGAVIGDMSAALPTRALVEEDFQDETAFWGDVDNNVWQLEWDNPDASIDRYQTFSYGGEIDAYLMMHSDQNSDYSEEEVDDGDGGTYTASYYTYDPTLNQATWRINLAGATRAALTFEQWGYDPNANSAYGGDFYGSENFDGVAISVDGDHWVVLQNFDSEWDEERNQYSVDLVQAAAAYGITLGADTLIRFQFYDAGETYDYDPEGRDYYRNFDNIRVTTDQQQLLLTPTGVTSSGEQDSEFYNSLDRLTDGYVPAEGTTWSSDSNVYWWGQEYDPNGGGEGELAAAASSFGGLYFDIDLGSVQRVADLVLSVDSNDDYAVDTSSDGSNWTRLIDIWSVYDSENVGEGMETFSTWSESPDFEGGLEFNPVMARYLRIYATNGDGAYAIGEVQAYADVVGDQEDWYSLTLAEYELASFTLSHENLAAGNAFALELYDQDENLLTVGIPVGGQVNKSIENFRAPAAGTYFLRVLGNASGEYNLAAVRQTQFGPATGASQDLTLTPIVLDALSGAPSEIRVAVLGGGNVISQLNDDSYFNFSASYVDAYQIDTLDELNNFDVVVMGNYVERSSLNQMALALRQWVEDGHGLVTTGWMIYYTSQQYGAVNSDLDAVIPINLNTYSDNTYGNPTVSITDGTHPVTQGVSNFFSSYYYDYLVYGMDGIDVGAATLGAVNGYPAVVVGTPVSGRSVALAPTYADGSNWNTGMADRLLEQAVAWSAQPVNQYTVQALAASDLTVSLDLIGTDGGQPGNDFEPVLELYDTAGNLLVSGSTFVSYAVVDDAQFIIKVKGTGSGDYLLRVNGDLPNVAQSLQVVSSSLDGVSNLFGFPYYVDLTFSAPVLYTSLENFDFRVNNTDADGFEILSPNQVRFWFGSAYVGDAQYDLTLGAAGVTDIHGNANAEWTHSFTRDTTGPVVTSSNVSDGDTLATGAQTLTFTFNEPLDYTDLNFWDVEIRETLSNQVLAFNSVSFAYDIETRTVTLETSDLAEGAYILTLASGYSGFKDVLGNILDGDNDGFSGGDFVLNFSVDTDTLAYPPMQALPPMGSLVYDPVVEGVIHAAGDVDTYTFSLDAGQKLTVVAAPIAADLQLEVAVLDADDDSEVALLTGVAGEGVVLQSLPGLSGNYRIEVRGLQGAGRYEFALVLNAVLEAEMLVGSSGNDSIGAAQDMEGSSLDLGNGGSRMAVVGDRLTATGFDEPVRFESNGHYYEVVLTGDIDWSTALAAAEARTFRGSAGRLASVTSLAENQFLTTAFGNGLDGLFLGGYQAEGSFEPDGGWAWHSLEEFSFNNWAAGEPNDFGNEQFLVFAHGIDAEGMQWNDANLAAGYVVEYDAPQLDDDVYRIHLGADQAASVALAWSDGASGELLLELVSDDGTVLAIGAADASNAQQAIREFVAPDDADYFLRVSGAAEGMYNLVVTRGMSFSLPSTATGVAAQDISLTGQVLGAVGGSGSVGGGGLVAVVAAGAYDEGLQAIVNQLNDHNYANVSAVLVSASQVDTLAELMQYDAVVIGGSGNSSNQFSAFAQNLKPYVEAGGGLVVTGWGIYAAGGLSGQTDTDFEAIVPVNVNSGYAYYSGGTLTPTGTHPIVQGVSDFYTPIYIEFSAGTPKVDAGATILANAAGTTPVAAAKEVGNGRTVYLGPIYSGSSSYNTSSLRTGEADQLMEQAVSWAAGDRASMYLFRASAGQTLTLTVATPGDGPGEPANDLVPTVELRDPNGTAVVFDEGSGSGTWTHTASISGDYQVRVRAESGAGDFVLRVSGINPSIPALTVTSTSITAGQIFNTAPTSVDVNFSQALRMDSIQAGDLLVNGQVASGVIVVDADTLRFDLSGLVSTDGVYTLAIQASALTGLSNVGNEEFSRNFIFDATLPTVTAGSVAEGESVASGARTLVFSLSEDLAASGLGAEDVLLTNSANGLSYSATSFVYNAETDQVTLQYASLPEGAYTLTLLSGASGFRDLVGNALNGDLSDADADNYVLHFNVDDATAALPALTALAPAGSLIYRAEVAGRGVHAAGDVDAFTVNLDAGQTLTLWAAQTAGSTRLAIELFDAETGGVSLGLTEATASGQTVLLQTIAISGGTYRIEVRSLEGAGLYTLKAMLNAALEAETVSGATNDTQANAQNLSASFIATGSDRAAVSGQLYAPTATNLKNFNGHYYELVTSSAYWTNANTSAQARTYLGASGHLATLETVEESQFINSAFGSSINGAWLGGYQTGSFTEPDGGWTWVTGQPVTFTNWASGLPDDSGGSENYMQFRSDADAEGKLWNDLRYYYYYNYLVEYEPAITNDWYYVHLDAGQKASAVLTLEMNLGNTDLALDLLDASGNRLTAGTDVAGNVDESILDFVAPEAGDYYLRVSGTAPGQYNLVLTRDQTFSLELASTLQDISPTGEVLGALGGSGGGQSIRVAVLNNGGAGNVVAQLNDDTWFNFTATSVTYTQIDTLAELAAYDVVMLGDSSTSHSQIEAIAPTLRQWVEAGGGVVGTGWLIYSVGSETGTPISDINAIFPVNTTTRGYIYAPTVDLTDPTHPVTQGVADFGASSYVEYPALGVDTGAVVLGNISGSPAVVVGNAGSGRSAYLGPIYMGGYSGLNTGAPDRLLEQAVAWAAGDAVDEFLIQVNTDDVLNVTTSTPGDGVGEPANLLDVRVELYDAAGVLVASNEDGAADGRNAALSYTALSGGAYKVKVIKETDSARGEYVLRVTGATGVTNLAPQVVAASPTEAKRLTAPPTSLTLDLSEGILAASVSVDDLSIDGGATVTGVEVLDGDSVRFLLDVPDVEGTFTYTLLAGGISDLQGAGNVAHSGSFIIDKTGPRVVSQTPEVQSISPFSTWSVTFSEALDPSTVQTSDFVLRNPSNGAIGISTATLSADGLTVTLTFGAQYTEGDYTLTVGPEIRDLAGNRMDQDSATVGDQTYLGVVDVAAPDLSPVSVSITLPDGSALPETGVALGSQVKVTWVVRNIGTDAARAGYWYDSLWLSSDTNAGGDTHLGTYSIDVDASNLVGLPAGEQYTMSATVTLPLNDNFNASNYFIRIQTDDYYGYGYNNQPENNENNNGLFSNAFVTLVPPLPDLTVSDVVMPAVVEAGKGLTVSWIVHNQGDAVANNATGYWYDRIVLSTNQTFDDADDVYLGQIYYYDDISPGGQLARSATVTVPVSSTGAWNVLVKTDYYNYLYERANEGNNVGVSAAQVQVVVATEDLQPIAITAPELAVLGGTIDVTWTVQNVGTGPSYSDWQDRLVLSTDQVYGNSDDIHLAQVSASSAPAARPLAAGAAYTRSVENIVLPLNPSLNTGTYYLLLKSDHYGDEPELNEANNVFARAITMALPQMADLTVSHVVVPPSEALHSGDTVTVNFTLNNQGDGAAANFHNYLYLSSDGVSRDISVGDYYFEQTLAAGASVTVEKAITIPLYNPGDWFLVVVSDPVDYYWAPYGNVYEHTNEGNNSAGSASAMHAPLPPLPDLVVSNIVAPLDALAGEDITISWTITNQGEAVSGPWSDSLYLSTDGGVSNNIYLGNFAFEGTLAAGASITRTQAFTLSATLDGARTVVVYTDAGNQVNETHQDQGNNRAVDDTTLSVTFPPLPNLQVTDLTPPSDPTSGSETIVSWVVTNTGTGATSAPVWYDQIHLSLDTIWGNGDDTDLGYVINPNYLSIGESYQNSRTISIPKGLNGDYYFLVKTDAFNYVFEDQKEGDNVTVSPLTHIALTPPPDLRVQSVEAPNQSFSGQTVSVSWTVINDDRFASGRTAEAGWYDRVVMSTNPDSADGGRNMGDFWHAGALDSGESYEVTKTINLPVGEIGEFYFFVITDVANHVYEHGYEFNNAGKDMLPDESGAESTTILLTPPPDLEVVSVTAPLNAEAGHVFNASWRVANYGSTATPNNYWTDNLYLSADGVLDASDVYLGSRSHYGVLDVYEEDAAGNAVGGFYDTGTSFTLPFDLTGGYRLIVKTDAGSQVFEGLPNPSDPYGENNNVTASGVMTVISRPADLVVDTFTAPASGEAGKQISVSWTVRNDSTGDSVANAWFDRVLISFDQDLGDADDIVLADFGRGGLIGAGGSYTRNETVTLPFSLEDGNYWLYVLADINSNVYESNNDNNSAFTAIAVDRETPDLQIVSLSHEATGTAGLPLDISWRVENQGTNQTNVNNWYDDVYLSLDQVLDSNDTYLGQRYRNSGLAEGAGYDASSGFSLPNYLATNDYFVIVRTDRYNTVTEGSAGEANNVRVSDSTVHVEANAPIPPDLTVVSVDAPPEAISGQNMQITWTVRNDGPGSADGSTWYDAVYLSRDGVLDRNADMYLGYAYHTGLGVGETYTQSLDVQVPFGQSGPFYVFVATDAGRYITEANELNNTAQDAAFTQVSLAPPADLVVGTITLPVNGIPGRLATIDFSVNNQGTNPAMGSWSDSIYLSTDETWDINDALFGVAYHYGTVAGGSSYSNSLTATLPGVTPGDYHVIVRSDIRNRIPESNEANNIGGSLDAVALDVEELTLGSPATYTLGSGQAVYYKFTVGAGETVRLALDSLGVDIANELYVRYGSMPTRGQFDFAARDGFTADPELVIPTSQAGTYYVLAYGQYAPGNPQYSITAQIIPFSITDVDATIVGNSGDVTLRIEGARFGADTEFSLVAPDGVVIKAHGVYLDNSSEAYATFSLFQASVGMYDVVVEKVLVNADGSRVVLASSTRADAISVEQGNDAAVFMSIAGPTSVMVNRANLFSLDYVNDGGADVMAPLIILESFSATPMGMSASNMHTSPIQILAASYDGPMDILRPGARYSVPIVFQSPTETRQLDMRAGRILANDVRLIEDWGTIEASIRPSSIGNDEWEAFWSRIQPLIGTTWGEYVQVINHMMMLVSDPGHPIRDVRDIFARMYQQNPDYVPYANLNGTVHSSVDDTPLADVQMGAYRINDDGSLTRAASAISDASGAYTFTHLTPGLYQVVAIGRALDMDRNGQVDLGLPASVTLGHTEPGNAGVIYIQPIGSASTSAEDDSNPALARDANGITHMVWNRDGLVWHSWFDSDTGQWRDATAISTGQSYAPTIATSAYLLDGINAGLLAAWQQGSGNEAEIWYAVGRAKAGGGFEWSAPVQLTNDTTGDVSPEVIIGDTGVAMITHLKRNDAIQDDSDIYYDLLGLSAAQFVWPSAVVASADTALETSVTAGASVAYGAQWKFGPWDFFGTKAEIALALSGQVAENNCTATLGAQGQLSGSFTGGSIRSTISGSGSVGAEWTVNEAARDWMFNRATASWSAGAQFDWRYGLSTVLSKIPHPAVTAAYASYRGAVAIASYMGLDFEDGITFGGNASFTGMEWKFAQPFPAFVWPESVSEASISGLIGVYAQLDTATGDSARLQGDLTVTVDIAPAVQLKSVTGNITLSGNIGWWTFNEAFIVNFYQASDVALLDVPLTSEDASGPVFNPGALIGTGNVYAGTALLGAGVSSDVTADSAVTLANDDGTIFGAWTHMIDPHNGIGDEVMVSVYGAGWANPIAIAGSLGINADATAAVDSLGRRMVVWSHADSSGLGSNPGFDEFRAASDAADVFYAVYDESTATWSAPVSVAATLGRDDSIEVTHDASGNLVMTWIVEGGEGGLDRLMSATWNGSAWSAAQEIATGASIGDPAIERLGDDIIVVWEANAAEEQGETENTLHYAIYDEAAWSAGALFDPIAMMTGLALSAGDPATIAATLAAANAALQTESVFPPFPVPEECLKCKPEDIKRIRESAPECIPGGGTQVTFDPKTCTEKTIVYKPCVVRPRDPNDIIGPTGFGDEKWTAAKNAMGYTIRFENAADASAPAQQVVITQQLDADLDWRTFRVDDFGFGDQNIELDGKSAFYQNRLDYTADPTRGYYLDVAAAIDVSTGIVTWTLTTIDPNTGDTPQDALIGFLPVNDTVYDANHQVVGEPGSGRGEGYVSYSIKAKRDLDSGTVVDAEARIVFDTEEPIDTPFIFNTLDSGVPESHVTAFANATTTLNEFLVSWVGEDDAAGSGVRDYTVYVSVDGGDYVVWQADTALNEAIYIGATGRTYSFFSTVRDNAGNEEIRTDTADASITVGGASGALSGVKFEDVDGDGVRDAGEAGLAGWTLFVDSDNDGALDEDEARTSTGEDGAYSFIDLTPGDYSVRELMQSGWMQTLPSGDGSRTVTVVADQTATGVDFGNFKLAQIGGQKINDLNANGVLDAGESGAPGWVIQLDKNADGSIDATQTTDAYGYYRFTDLGPGSYRLSEVMQAGWLQTGAASHTVSSSSGADIGSQDFANVQAASISGVKFEDSDGDGQHDAGETGLAGWTIFLDANANGSLDNGEHSFVTGTDGAYRFDDLLPGEYVVAEVMQDGWTQTSPGTGPSGLGSTSLTLSGMNVVLSLPEDVLVAEGLTTQAVSANELADALVGLDAFRNDLRFSGINGSGVTTVVIDTGIDLNHAWFGSDANANGVADRIVFSYDFADGDADASDRNGHGSHVASLIGGQNATYGGVAEGANLIALKVFSDSGSGYFSYLEEALQWVVNNGNSYNVGVINLSLGDGGNWDSAIGRYGLGDELAALAGMNILVTAATGNNYFQLGSNMGVAYPAADPAVLAVGAVWSGSFGGPVNYANGAIDFTTGADHLAAFGQRDDVLMDVLAPGTRMMGANYNGGTRTMFGTSQASGYMAGVATLAQDLALDHLGRRLSLGEFSSLLSSTSVWVNDGDDESDNVTNTGLNFARVDMLALAEGILSMQIVDLPGDGGTPIDNGELHPLAAPGVHTLTLSAGTQVIDADFGNFALGSLSGTLFHDLNANAVQGAGEMTLGGWSVFLDSDADGQLDVGEHSAVTDIDGNYRFDDVGPGTYRVTLLGQDGWVHTTDSFFDVFMTSGLDADGDFGVNAKPTLDAIADVTLDEGGVVDLSAAGHDTAGDGLNYSLVGEAHGATLDAVTGQFLWAALDGNASQSFTLRVTDSAGSMADRTFTATVNNVDPTLTLAGPDNVTDDQNFVLSLSSSDPGMDTISNWAVNWGDGSSSLLSAASGNLSHRYALPGDYTVSASATDEDGSYAASRAVNVQAGTLKVTNAQATATGFRVNFNRAYVPELLNLYDSAVYNRGAADLRFKDAAGRAVAGSVVLDADHMGLTFVKTNGMLANGNYSLTLDSRTNAFVDSVGGLLDGNRDGIAGDNFSTTFAISGSGAVMSIGEFSRGPGQAANVVATTAGVPILITGATGARQVAFTLAYDVSLLNITGVTGGAGVPVGSTVSADFGTPGQVRVTVQLSAALGAGSTELIKLIANVPSTAPYGAKQVLDLKNILLDTGAAVRDDDGLHLVAYTGDASGNAKYSTLDVQRIQRAVVKLDSGFGAYPLVDPTVVADVSGNNVLTSLDAQRLLSEVMGIDRPEIPAIPKGMTLTFSGPDPFVSISSVDAKPGETVVVPVNLDTAAGLESVELTLVYPADNLELVDVRLGGLTQDFQYFVKDVSVAGRVSIDMSRMEALQGGAGSVLELVFKVGVNAKGNLAIDLQSTALNETWLTLNPAPVPGSDPTDGAVKVKLPPPVVVKKPAISSTVWTSDFVFGQNSQPAWVNQWLSANDTKSVVRKLNNWKVSLPSAKIGTRV